MRVLLLVLMVTATPFAMAQNWVGLLKNTPAEQLSLIHI